MKRCTIIILAFTLILSLVSCQTELSEYPNRDVTVIIPFEAGGGIDISGRSLFTEMDKLYPDTKFIPTNITGASGTIGATELYYADNDGYTLLVGGNGMNVAHVSNGFELTYDDYELVSQFVVSLPGLFVRADSPYQTYEDLINASLENSGSVKMGVVVGTVNHFATMAIENETGAQFQQIIVGGNQPQQPELLSGRVDAYVTAVSQNKAYLESGDFRCLGVFADDRVESMPDVPTMSEMGVMDDYQLFFGIWGPKGMPQEAIDTLNASIEEICQDEAFIESMDKMGYTVEYQGAEAYTQRMADSLTNILDLWDIMGLGDDAGSLDPYNTPYTVPIALMVAIVILGICEIFRKKYQNEPFNPQFIGLFKGNVPPFILSLFVYSFAFEILGYTFATTIYLSIMVLFLRKSVHPTLDKKLIPKVVGISLVFSIVSYLFFTQVAGIIMPVSPLGVI